MNSRNLSQDEKNKTDILDKLSIPYALLFLTQTGLKKSILDSTASISHLLKEQKVHDFDLQKNGVENKVRIPCIILSNGQKEETTASFYRATTRGDTRFWIGRLHNFATPDQAFALFIENENMVSLNLSDGRALDPENDIFFSEILNRIKFPSNEFSALQNLDDDTNVQETDSSELDEPSRFEVSSYGWDSDVEGLVKRLNREDIKLPRFQRGFVWSTVEQSRFIESLILGLPVPNIFLALDRETKILNIVDGQQRLKTLQRYLKGDFALSNSKLIHEDLRGCYYNRDVAKGEKSKVLESADERTLSDSILHSIVIKPDPASDSPEYGQEYNNAVVQIFRRLNTSGKALQPQEVRSCIFYGPLDELIHNLNKHNSWRAFFGKEHSRYKDVEIILRFFALYEDFETYKAPMPSFLNKYMEKNRNINGQKQADLKDIFEQTTNRLLQECEDTLFKASGTFLLSKFDAITVGLAKAYQSGVIFNEGDIKSKVEILLNDEEYQDATIEFINDTGNVLGRIRAAIRVFEG